MSGAGETTDAGHPNPQDGAPPLRELTVTRLIRASPERVYRVWTERTGEWFAPLPYRTPEVELDLRPGGRSRIVMEAPDGTRMPSQGVFLEVVPNERLVFTDAFAPGWAPQGPFMLAIVTFEPEDLGEGEKGGTRYTARVRHWSEDDMKRHEAMGFHEGWGTVAAQLAALAEAD